MMFKVFHGVAMNYGFKKYENHRYGIHVHIYVCIYE